MSSTDTGPSASAAPEDQDRRSVPLLIAAAALVVGVVGAVLLFGIDRPPALATLADDPTPAPPAAVAWTVWRGGESCLEVARPDGTTSEVRCERDGGEFVGWSEEGNLLLSHHGEWRVDGRSEAGTDEMRVIEVAADTGEVVETRWVPVGDLPAHQGARGAVTSYREGGQLVVEAEGAEIWRVEAPETYRVRDSSASPDGSFFAVVDSAERLLVIPADGSAPPRIWAEDVAAWMAPLWEGELLR